MLGERHGQGCSWQQGVSGFHRQVLCWSKQRCYRNCQKQGLRVIAFGDSNGKGGDIQNQKEFLLSIVSRYVFACDFSMREMWISPSSLAWPMMQAARRFETSLAVVCLTGLHLLPLSSSLGLPWCFRRLGHFVHLDTLAFNDTPHSSRNRQTCHVPRRCSALGRVVSSKKG